MKNALVIMAKRPLLGQTKTRLTPPLAPEQAAELYACFLRDTIDLTRQVSNASRLIAYAPIDAQDYFEQLAPDFLLIPQMGNDLGERLANVMSECLGDKWEQLVIMDSDSPTLPAQYIVNAFDALGKADVVLGPCVDGGYYLIGVKRPQRRLVHEVKMSTPNVLQDTLAIAHAENLSVALTDKWYDVDTASELEQLRKELHLAKQGIALHTRKYLETLCTSMS